MARSHRLFDLMQALRRHRRTVTGAVLARELGVSLRTIRRDVATLQSMGAEIDGEAGVGYILKPGFLLPPLSFTADELQALVIGAQWVQRQTDRGLAEAVANALAKIDAVLPADMRSGLEDDAVYVGGEHRAHQTIDLSEIRRALREQRKVTISLAEPHADLGQQVVWPIMLGIFDSGPSIAAWCEHDHQFRIIGVADIVTLDVLTERYPIARRKLVKEWRALDLRPCNARGDIC